jgi:hypothetical protein
MTATTTEALEQFHRYLLERCYICTNTFTQHESRSSHPSVIECWMGPGCVVLVRRVRGGFEAYAPVCDSNDVNDCIAALGPRLGGDANEQPTGTKVAK